MLTITNLYSSSKDKYYNSWHFFFKEICLFFLRMAATYISFINQYPHPLSNIHKKNTIQISLKYFFNFPALITVSIMPSFHFVVLN